MTRRRPLRSRIWFYKPWPGYLKPEDGFYTPRWWWVPISRGGDEFNWHTIVIGNPVIGSVVIATRRCPQRGRCEEVVAEFPEEFSRDWPIDAYGHNHDGVCTEPDCYCIEPIDEAS